MDDWKEKRKKTKKNQYHEYFTIHYSCSINLETHG